MKFDVLRQHWMSYSGWLLGLALGLLAFTSSVSGATCTQTKEKSFSSSDTSFNINFNNIPDNATSSISLDLTFYGHYDSDTFSAYAIVTVDN